MFTGVGCLTLKPAVFCVKLSFVNFPLGQYPLHTACAKGDVKVARYLVSQGHFVNDTNFDLVQPLHEACLSGSEECVRFLLEAGAQVFGV